MPRPFKTLHQQQSQRGPVLAQHHSLHPSTPNPSTPPSTARLLRRGAPLPAHLAHTPNDLPQPHESAALGLLNLKPPPISSSE